MLYLPMSLGNVRCTPAERRQDSDSFAYQSRVRAPLTLGEGTESWISGEPPSPTLWRQICQSGAFSSCDACISGCGNMKFSTIAHRRVLGETRASRSTLEVVGTGGVAGKDAKCPMRTRGTGGGHQQRKCGKEHLF